MLLVGGVAWAQEASPDTTVRAQATPSNDNLRDAKRITTFELSQEGPWSFGNNYHATRQPGEPRVTRYNSVWYRWTAPRTGRYRILVESKQFDEMLSVWTGPPGVRQLKLEAANDDCWVGPDRVSAVYFFAQAGTPYWIAVSGYFPGGEGRFQIEGTYDGTPINICS